MVNCYLTCDQTFHHKVVELLYCGRPILCFSSRPSRGVTLTQRVGGDLRSCTSPADIVNGLVHAEATLNAPAGPRNERLRELTWGAQAQILDRVLLKCGEPTTARMTRIAAAGMLYIRASLP